MDKKKKRFIAYACGFALLVIFIASPLFPYLRSLVLMSVYSNYCDRSSIMEKEDIEITIPSGENWYPFVMTYTADSAFSAYSNLPETKLTILYNFPAFSLKEGCSNLFNEQSPYYSSFYGAYLVQRNNNLPYGFSAETKALSPDAVSDIAKFDVFLLVLGDFGLSNENQLFEYKLYSEEKDLSFAGSDGWTRICSDIKTNGMSHNDVGFKTSYLQYGFPNFPVSSDFSPIEMKSIIYGKYFEEWNTSVFFYVMSLSEKVCEECEVKILSLSTIKSKN